MQAAAPPAAADRLQEGIAFARQATQLDAEGNLRDALPFYQAAVASLTAASVGMTFPAMLVCSV